MSLSPGPFITCFLTALFLIGYVYFIIYVKKDIIYGGIKYILAIIGLILVRMILPFDFPFTITLRSEKILPLLYRILGYRVGNTEIRGWHLLFFVWTLGTIVCLIYLFYSQILYRRCLYPFLICDWSGHKILSGVLKRCNASDIQVCIVPGVSPSVSGIFRPILVLPDLELSEEELYFICRHEIEHYRNHDLWMKLFLEVLICVQWFNPLVYILKRELELAFEVSNDQVVIKECSPMQEIAYAECIHKAAKSLSDFSKNFGVSFIGSSKDDLETRLNIILKENFKKPNRKYVVMHCVIVGTMFVIALFLVPEAYIEYTDGKEETVISIQPDNSYIVKGEDGYRVFVDGAYFLTIDSIPVELSDFPIIEEETER
jgi:beta-lactamase regulating signal transducer with metallopeptidase domain